MNKMKELFDGIFTYNYTEGCSDDTEIFAMFKAGISNLSSKEDQNEMFEYFRKKYINVWINNVKRDYNDPDLDKAKIEAEDAFKEYWEN